MTSPSDPNPSTGAGEPRARLLDPDIIFTLVIGLVVIFALITSSNWQFEAALMPRVVAVAALLLIVSRLVGRVILVVRGAPAPPKQEIMDLPVDDDAQPGEFLRRAVQVAAWVFGLIFASLLAGVQYTAPIFLFVYLVFQAKLAWWKALIFVAASIFIIHIAFADLLGIRIPEGLLFEQGNRR